MKLWLVLLSIYYEFLYKKFFQKKFSDQVYSYVILSIWNIYQTFPVIPTIGTFVATELLGRVTSKNKQHLVADNISLRFWSIFVISLLLSHLFNMCYFITATGLLICWEKKKLFTRTFHCDAPSFQFFKKIFLFFFEKINTIISSLFIGRFSRLCFIF